MILNNFDRKSNSKCLRNLGTQLTHKTLKNSIKVLQFKKNI